MKETILEVSYTYDPLRDLGPVDQFGFVDLRDAFVHATVPGDLKVSESDFNGVDEPASLMNRPSDRFDALRKASYVKGAESSVAAAGAAAASSPIVEPSSE